MTSGRIPWRLAPWALALLLAWGFYGLIQRQTPPLPERRTEDFLDAGPAPASVQSMAQVGVRGDASPSGAAEKARTDGDEAKTDASAKSPDQSPHPNAAKVIAMHGWVQADATVKFVKSKVARIEEDRELGRQLGTHQRAMPGQQGV